MDYFIFGEFMSCFIDFIDINLLEKYTLTNLVSEENPSELCPRERLYELSVLCRRWLLRHDI